MLTGILVPTSGEVRVAGLVPWKQRRENARNIGVIFGQRSQLYWDLPLIESFELLRAIYGVPRDRYRAQPRRVRRDARDGRASAHARAAAFARDSECAATSPRRCCTSPQIVYLDEPTIGLDVVAKEAIREFIARINAERRATIVLTTHDLADVERLCRRIVLIDRGTIIYDGDIERIKSEYGRFRTLVVHFCEPVEHPHLDGAELAGVEGFERALSIRPQPAARRLAGSPSQRTLSRRGREHGRAGSRIDHPAHLRSKATAGRRRTRHDSSSGAKKPKIHSSAYVAPSATIGGRRDHRRRSAPFCTARSSPPKERRSPSAPRRSSWKTPCSRPAAAAPCSFRSRSASAASSARTRTSSARRSATAASSPRGARFSTARRSRTAAASRSARSCTSTRGCRRRRAFRCCTSRTAIRPRSMPPERAPEVHAMIDFYADVFNLEAGRRRRGRAAETYAKFLRKTHAQDAPLDEHEASSRRAAPLGRGAAADAGHRGRQGRRRHDARARRDGAAPAASDQTAKRAARDP